MVYGSSPSKKYFQGLKELKRANNANANDDSDDDSDNDGDGDGDGGVVT